MKLKLLLLSVLLCLGYSTQGQVCGTPPTTNYPQENRKTINPSYRNASTDICFNVFYHIVRESNGTGGFNPVFLNQVTQRLNEAFNSHRIYANNLGFDYINNSTYYNIDDVGNDTTEFDALVQINNRSDAINVYIVDSAAGYSGRANGILSQALVIEMEWVNTQVVSHEVGHCLDLWHTFQGTAAGTSGCAEAINGSNCTTCGDLVCDTPADANTGNSSGYTPDMDNIMSYYFPFHHFTDGQITRIRDAFSTSSILEQTISNSCTIPSLSGPSIICYSANGTTFSLQNGGTSVSWNISSNLQILTSSNTSITVKPISSSTSGSGFVEGTLALETIRENIWVGTYKPTHFEYVIVDPWLGRIKARVLGHEDVTSYIWYLNGQVVSGQNTDYGVIPIPKNNCNIAGYIVGVKAINPCGTSSEFYQYFENPCYQGGYYYNYSPNPTSGTLTIERSNTDAVSENSQNSIQSETHNYKLYDFNGNIVLYGLLAEKTILDVSRLTKGRYILKIEIDRKISETHHIIVN